MKVTCGFLMVVLFLSGCNYDGLKARNAILEDSNWNEVFAVPLLYNQSDSAPFSDHAFVARKQDGSVWFYVIEPVSNSIKGCSMVFPPMNVKTNENR